MSFRQSASNIRVDDGHILRASIQNGNGDWVDAEIDLDGFIGNSNGRFEWGGENFSHSAEDIRFSMEGANGDIPVLRARLSDVDGNLHDADINLDERIGNEDGNLSFA
ncbi:hypothetical protein PLIIFM63780_008029 [Purpureocillium lilacinum]|uniref:Cyanovirin-N domain-containing protein n=1 Tax=Purpureocillium lilacinum TaxID=33203 RepID=A0A2U3EG04_PURLI|nr:hypothetical protein Purlil1_7147 [Purpureocillium lilacinum]PWI73455.1 hypothetical protein PCL_08731 [Purpureocillium lilacinum]GJN73958.1 hypothetical protein PLICBS_008042 [Purpureocillium lilacinum]GJN84472.1 hypothetical protein PLIIFM63780_008029 [Purpureocillium lilacinum]